MNVPTPELPPHIPDYAMLRRIGGGSYGSVWIARTATGIYRAVKVVWRAQFEDAEPYEREFRGLREFERVSLSEARQLALLHVGRHDDEGFFYYVMELADDVGRGRDIEPESYRPLTLRELRRAGGLAVAQVVELGVELARGLAVLHDRGLVHRDIKPSNIILVDGSPKLADIGLVTSSTLALTFVGTEGFVAPEGPGAPAADVYGLGKVLYELATGLDRNIFPQLPEDFAAREDRLAFLELNAVVLRACEPDVKRRHQDARALLEDLLLVQAGKSVRRLRAAERGLARALKLTAVLAAVAAVAGAGAWVAWERAQREMALRAVAEAERDALARKTQYAGLMAQASWAVAESQFGLARKITRSAHGVVGAGGVGPEWDWLANASWGDATTIWRREGAGILRLAANPVSRALAWVDRAGETMLVDRGAPGGEVRRPLTGFANLAGWSADGAVLWGVDGAGSPVYWRSGDGSTAGGGVLSVAGSPLQPLTPVGVLPDGAMVAIEGRSPGRRWRVVLDEGTLRGESWGEMTGDAKRWDLFRWVLSPDGRWLAAAWLTGQGDTTTFCLTVDDVNGRRVTRFTPEVRPAALGWVVATAGLKLEIADDATGAHGWYEPATENWTLAADRLEPAAGAWHGDLRTKRRRVRGATLEVTRDGQTVDYRGHGGVITDDLQLPGTGELVSGAEDGTVLGWSEAGDGLPRRVAHTEIQAAGRRFEISREGERIYLPGDAGVEVVGRSGRVLDRWSTVRWIGSRLPSGLLGLASDGRTVVEVDEVTGRGRPLADPSEVGIANLGVTEDQATVVYTCTDGTMWRQDAGSPRQAMPLKPDWRWSLQLDAASRSLWFTNRRQQLVRWDLQTNTKLWAVELPAVVAHVERIPRMGLLVLAVTNGQLHVVDALTGQTRHIVETGSPSAEIVTVDEARQRVYVGGNDGAVHVFETRDWMHVATFRLPEGEPLWMLKAAENGSSLAGLTRDGQLYVIAETGDRPE